MLVADMLCAARQGLCVLLSAPLLPSVTIFWHEHKPIAVHAGAAVLRHSHYPAVPHRELRETASLNRCLLCCDR